MSEVTETRLPVTTLTEEEVLFREDVRDFAEKRVKPQVMDMDRAGKLPRELIDELFTLGVMGIEIPQSYGGAGSNFLMSILGDRRTCPRRPVSRGLCRCAKHPGQ